MYDKLKEAFSFVGVIDKTKYPNYENYKELENINSIFVIGLSYPFTAYKQQNDKLVASVYTYGKDYHNVLKKLVDKTLKGYDYKVLVDNHNLNERLCLSLTGLAYLGKNDLMIHKDFGSYFFIGLVLTNKHYKEVIVENADSCGECVKCINSCPVNALQEGFDVSKCLSARNQLKEPFTDEEIKRNYLLLGCDICQRVCPKNKIAINKYHKDLLPQDTLYIEIDDLFDLSNREFQEKYGNHAYLWKGKTILLRNALTILLRQKNTFYNKKIEQTIKSDKYPLWYKEDARKIYNKLLIIEKSQ